MNKLRSQLYTWSLDIPLTRVTVWFETDVGLPTVYQCRGAAECLLMIDDACTANGWTSIFQAYDGDADADDPRTPVQRAIEEFLDMEMYITMPDGSSVRFGCDDD